MTDIRYTEPMEQVTGEQATERNLDAVFESALADARNQPPTVYDSRSAQPSLDEPTVDMLPPADD